MQEWTLGKKVKEARLSKKMTQREVSKDFITRNMLSKIENDTATPSIKTIEYLSKVLGRPISYFMDYSPVQSSDLNNYINLSSINKYFKDNNYLKCINEINIIIKSKDHRDIVNNQELYLLLAFCHFKEGNNYLLRGKLNNAEEYYYTSLELLSKSIYTELNIYSEIFYGLYQISLYKKDSGLMAENHNKFYSYHKSRTSILDSEIFRLEALYTESKYEIIISQSKNIKIENMNHFIKSKFYLILGKSYYKINNLDSSLKYLLEAEKIIKLHNIKLYSLDVYEFLGKINYKIGNFKEAYDYTLIANKLIKEIE
ncbi:MAG: helix-turn-helix transcriptional regulator [Clostridiales bacterium]